MKYGVFLFIICSLFAVLEFQEARNSDIFEVDETKSLMTAIGFDASKIESLSSGKVFYQSFFFENNNIESCIQNNITDESGNCSLYSITLHYWINIFGFSLTAIRTLSIIFSIGTILLTYSLCTIIFENKTVALISAILCASNSLILAFGIRTRTYSMAVFLSLLGTYLFILLLQKIRANHKSAKPLSLLYGIAVGLSVLAHYFCVYILFIHLLFAVPLFFKLKSQDKWIMITAMFCFVVIISSWMLIGGIAGLPLMADGNEWHLNYAKGNNKLSSMTQITNMQNAFAYIRSTFLTWTGNGTYWNYFQFGIKMRYIIILFIIPVIFILSGVFHLRKKYIAGINLFLFLILLCTIGPIFCLFLAFKAGHTVSFSERYALLSLPYLIIIISFGIQQLISKKKWILVGTAGMLILHLGNIILSRKLDLVEREPHFQSIYPKVNNAIQYKLETSPEFRTQTIEYPYAWLALRMNLTLFPILPKQAQRINTEINKNKIFFFNKENNKRTLLYTFPNDYNATPNYHSK